MSEEASNEFEELVESMMGGEDHSPEADTGTEKTLEENTAAPEAEADDSALDEGSGGADDAPEKDSASDKQEAEPDADIVALRAEIANYEKRLHDTQKAMHQAKAEKADLQKQLDAFKTDTSGKGDDDWFASDGEKETAGLRAEIKDLNEKQKNLEQDMARERWMSEAERESAKHDDFEDVVFKKLEPLLDETSGDPRIRALYMQEPDKSPAGAYKFAKKLPMLFSVLDGKGLESPGRNENLKPAPDPTKGKAGLDRINSADFAEKKAPAKNMIEEVFG